MSGRWLTLILIAALPSWVLAYEPCGVRLSSLSAATGSPGEQFVMYGAWGASQGEKIPVINKGGMRRLEVIAWSPDAIVVRIPASLGPGGYRVGVYCNDFSQGGTYSSGFADFQVIGGAGRAGSEPRPEGIAGSPDDPDPGQRSRGGSGVAGLSLPVLVGWVMLAGAAAWILWRLLRRRGGRRV